MLRGWSEAVEAALTQTLEPVRAAAVAARYAEAFPLAYRTDYGAAEAAIDIGHMRRIVVGEAADNGHAPARRDVRLYAHDSDQPGRLRPKLYVVDRKRVV